MLVKLLIIYNVKPSREEEYLHFMMTEFLPTAQTIGLVMVDGWRTAWGDYPQRLIGLVAESQKTMNQILGSERWHQMEAKLAEYASDYQRKAVAYRDGFQFLRPT